ncbi:MAG: DUF58 domain-containing protein [Planctomycetes bacterium]|nr:DUF58 domain-containing protein [Planctomycetota bacterium]
MSLEEETADEIFAPELMARVRQIQLRTRRMVSEVLAGAYRSTFKGSGIEFDDIRPYQPGDDVRAIDWKRTARSGEPFIKTYVEERELSLMFVVDLSRTMDFGSRDFTKREVAAQMVALLSYVAARQHDRVGLTLFGPEVGLSLAPRKGAGAVARVVREVLAARPTAALNACSSFDNVLGHCARSMHRHSLLFVISDFAVPELRAPGEAPPWRHHLIDLAGRHDVVLARVTDPFELEPPAAGWLTLESLGSGTRLDFDARRPASRAAWRREAEARAAAVLQLAARTGLDLIELSTEGSVADPIAAFFRARGRRRR